MKNKKAVIILGVLIFVIGVGVLLSSTKQVSIQTIEEYNNMILDNNIKSIEVLSQTYRRVFTDKDDINKILKLVSNMKGKKIRENEDGLAVITSNSYGIVLSDENNYVSIRISPTDFRVGNGDYYKSKYNYYIDLKNILEEI